MPRSRPWTSWRTSTDRSHAKGRETTDAAVEEANRLELDIDALPQLVCQGHRELHCRCGKASIGEKAGLNDGGAFARVTGDCPRCGNITFTAGEYKTVSDITRPGGDTRGQ